MNRNSQINDRQDWPKAGGFKNSIRLEFSIYVSGLVLFLMVITGYFVTGKFSDTVTASVVESLRVQARSFSETAGKMIISSDNPDELLLNNICQKLASNNPDLFWAGIADDKGKFLAHTDIKQVITGAHLNFELHQNADYDKYVGDQVGFRGDTIFIQIPIEENGVGVGWLGMASSTRKINEARLTTIITVATITALMIILGIPLTVLLLNRKLRPIKMITDGLKQMNYDSFDINIPLKSKNEFGYLSETLRVMGIKLKSAQADMLENERITRELEIAREIQANILPRKYPVSNQLEFAGAYQSAREVGGDYYDFIEIDQDNIAFLVADVSGKSLPGMLVMLLTRDIIRQLSRTVSQPADLLMEVNRELRANIKRGMFVTMFYGLLNKKTGEFRFASAGHNPLIHIRAKSGEIITFKTKGFPLGMVPTETFEQRIETGQIILGKDDWLIQYTDGINEAQNSNGQEYGMNRFINSLKGNKGLAPKEIVDIVFKNHKEFVGEANQFDDITLLVMKWKANMSDNNAGGKTYEIIANHR